MKGKFFILLFGILLTTNLFATNLDTKPVGLVSAASVAPVIDGIVDDVWSESQVFNIDKNYNSDLPTLGEVGATNFRVLWTSDGIYVLVTVADDAYFPQYIAGTGATYYYDRIELYFDVNNELIDGLGPYVKQGHYQIVPELAANKETGEHTTRRGGVAYAFMVDAPNYLAEIFVPWSKLKDKNGNYFNKLADLGFDVNINDRDPGDEYGNRAVWASTINHSWSNMDDCGVLQLVGSSETIQIDSLNLIPDTLSITTDNGTIQIETEIFPENATYKEVSWHLENLTGRANLSPSGLLKAIKDGEVKVICKTHDGSNIQTETIVTITNQIVNSAELTIIKNGSFQEVDTNGLALYWEGGDFAPLDQVVDSVSVHTPLGGDNFYMFYQAGFKAIPNTEYILRFEAWADSERPLNVGFLDKANLNNAYGASDDQRSSPIGRSLWTINLSTVPTYYQFIVSFDEIMPNTIESLEFWLNTNNIVTYIDNISLISIADKQECCSSVPEHNAAESVTVYPIPAENVLNVQISTPNAIVQVYNSLGQIMDEIKADGTNAILNVTSYPKGMYLVKVNGTVAKFVK
jgi:hypothetical protein